MTENKTAAEAAVKTVKKGKSGNTKLAWFGLKFLAPWIRPYRMTLFLMVVPGILGGLVDIILPFFPDYAIRNFIGKNSTEGMGSFTAAYLLVLLFQILMNGISAYKACGMEMYVGRDLKNEAFHRLQVLSVSFYNQNSVGYLHARVMSDTDRIGTLLSWNLMEGIWYGSYLIGASAVMLRLRPDLALFVLLLIPLTAAFSAVFQKHLIRLGRLIREINGRLTGDFNEGITGAMTVKTLGIEEKMDKRFFTESGEMRRAAVTSGHLRGLFLSLISFSGFTALALVLWKGGRLTEQGLMELGTLSVFMSYALGIMDPVRWVVKVISDLITVQVNIERFASLVTAETDVKDTEEVIRKYGDSFAPKPENWESVRGDVQFDDVTFRYPDGSVNVLEHFDLKVPKGSMVAIVGETGAGKSTLVNLVCRFFEPTEGRVLLDGRDLRERSQHWLHSHIGYVLQTPHLFSGTVLDNLRFGRPEATMETVQEAVRRVHAEDVIERLEDGYETDVGEGGGRLSAGERQLVSFARALVADPEIFVLDEATSSVDTETEQMIQRALTEVLKDRTSFVIAHRLSTIRKADMILVVHDGKITERGTHRELMAKRGSYYRLYARQYETEAV
ncbi:MAG: ABC transporter ATP-binding protein [Stomatobaculum sp.]|nr:ABC transporter ATP-binding protein [Stomatobaculum sp.]